MVAFGDDAHFFGCEVGELFFECGFFEVGFFVGPGEYVCDFDLSFFVDEDVVGAYVTDFAFDFVEVFGAADEAVEEVHQLLLLEVFAHAHSALDFLFEEVGVVLVA